MFLTLQLGAGFLDLRPLSAGETVLQLVATSLNARNQPELVLRCCAAGGAGLCFEGVRGDFRALAAQILPDTEAWRLPTARLPSCNLSTSYNCWYQIRYGNLPAYSPERL